MNEEEEIDEIKGFRCFGSVWENLKCFWQIENFSSLDQSVGEYFTCDPIPTVEENDVSWYMHLYPNGRDDEHADRVQFLLGCDNRLKKSRSLKAEVSLYISNSKGEVISGSSELVGVTLKLGTTRRLLEIQRGELLDSIHDDIVIVTAEIDYSRSVAQNPASDRILSSAHPYKSLCVDYLNLHGRAETDAIIGVGEWELLVHGSVLSARSQVFSEMLVEYENDDGSLNFRMDMSKYKCEVVEAMLHFLYTAKVDDLNVPLALDLLQIGHDYELFSLIAHCTTFMTAQLDESNVIQVLTFAASLSKCDVLLDRTIDYICENISADDFKSRFAFLKTDKDMLYEFLLHMKKLDST